MWGETRKGPDSWEWNKGGFKGEGVQSVAEHTGSECRRLEWAGRAQQETGGGKGAEETAKTKYENTVRKHATLQPI